MGPDPEANRMRIQCYFAAYQPTFKQISPGCVLATVNWYDMKMRGQKYTFRAKRNETILKYN
jgi:hypothetical protein